MNQDQLSCFTCKECGGRVLMVTHTWTILAGANSDRWQEWGPLREDHRWNYAFREKIEDDMENELPRSDFDDFDEDDSATGAEEYEIYGSETDKANDEYFVNCGNCDREIEFGWSQRDRQGLLLPVECSDFVPSESWPDPKYLARWQKMNWAPSGFSLVQGSMLEIKSA